MNVILPKPGTYVIAVSGGVDSRVLLDILHKHSQKGRNRKYIVAHLDHGMRINSLKDRKFVQSISREYGLPFVYKTLNLGQSASEARARDERYRFLNNTKKASNAQAVITAHHQDDLLETAIINILRGSGRKGLTSLSNQPELFRPLLGVPKTDLINYANQQGLTWHEDITNQDKKYLRNYVRHKVIPRIDNQSRDKFLTIINNLQNLNQAIDTYIVDLLQSQEKPGTLTRLWFNNLPHSVAKEILAAWFRSHNLNNFDRKTLERLVVNAKTAKTGQKFPLRGNYDMKVGHGYLALEPTER